MIFMWPAARTGQVHQIEFEVGTIIDIAKPHISDSIVGSSHLRHHHYYYY